MYAFADGIRYATLALAVVLAVVALRQWRFRRGESARWVAVTFFVLALVFLLSLTPEAERPLAVEKMLIVLLVAFPYFLYRFAASFTPSTRTFGAFALALTALLVLWSLVLPELPADGVERPTSLQLFIAVFLVQWTALSALVAVWLWRAGRGLSTVPRYRMRLLSVASLLLSGALIIAGVAPTAHAAWVDVIVRLLAFASVVLFFVGFAPPAWLREVWRRPELEKLRRGVADLVSATTPPEVTERVLPRMADLVGARGVLLLDDEERPIGRYGLTPEDAGDAVRAHARAAAAREVVHLPLQNGSVIVWTSPYAPFFGVEEFDLLRSLGGLTDLALDRARLFEYERESRQALERVDELKTHFIALASHELRTPAAVIHGIAATLHLRGDELAPEQREQLRRTLFEQTERLRRLIEQLLDLSRLEAGGIRITPEPLPVRRRVEELVLTVGGERSQDVRIDVPPDLQATADANAFDRVVSNLITNAFRYGEPPVIVSARQSDRHFRLVVEDRGRGVSPEFVPQLFDRFARSEESSGPVTEGAGLGLSIAKSYAHAHGGDLLYEDAEPTGARFELVLPVTGSQGASDAGARPTVP